MTSPTPETVPAESQVDGVAWPPLDASFPDGLSGLLKQLEQTQWLPREALEAAQRRQLAVLLAHAEAQSPHFRQRLKDAGLGVEQLLAPGGLAALPPLARRDLQANRRQIQAAQMPSSHLPLGEVSTSGSSGTPVVVTRTGINQMFWQAFTVRDHLWHRRDASLALAVTRANLGSDAPQEYPNWGSPVADLYATGPGHLLHISRPPAEQLAWLRRVDPGYFLTYPTSLGALLDEIEKEGARLPGLRQVRTIGETVSAHLRTRTRAVLGVDIADCYSSQELGNMAIQCPQSGLYHLMSEGYIVEVLDPQGAPCGEGETGRLVVTDLHNFATPLIRYDLGDYAEVGPVCSCGRGSPTLRRIVGRERNMVTIDGQRHWPLVGFHRFREVAPIIQYQLVQQAPERIDFRYVSVAPLSAGQEQLLTEIVREALRHPFEIQFHVYEGSIPLPASGKFEEFVNLLG